MIELLKQYEAAFNARIVVEAGGCHNWTGSVGRDGHGLMHLGYTNGRKGKRRIYAHRAAFMLRHNRELYSTEVVRHTCDNARCVNADHLILGTHEENVQDRVERGRSATGEGHGRARLNNEKVHLVRKEVGALISRFAKEFNVDRTAIRQIVQGKTWQGVGEVA